MLTPPDVLKELALQDRDEGLVHDLRSPLCALLGYLHLLERQTCVQTSPKALEYISMLREAADRLSEIAENFLEKGATGAHFQPLQPGPVSVSELFARLHNTFSVMAMQKGVTLDFESDIDQAWGNRPLLQRVLENLLSNALKFTPEGGRVRVKAVPQSGRCLFEVSDTGRGIAEEHRHSIFEGRRQILEEDRKFGFGLGLKVVKQIIEAHGGQIWVDSEPGAGARFIFWLPCPALPSLGFDRTRGVPLPR